MADPKNRSNKDIIQWDAFITMSKAMGHKHTAGKLGTIWSGLAKSKEEKPKQGCWTPDEKEWFQRLLHHCSLILDFSECLFSLMGNLHLTRDGIIQCRVQHKCLKPQDDLEKSAHDLINVKRDI